MTHRQSLGSLLPLGLLLLATSAPAQTIAMTKMAAVGDAVPAVRLNNLAGESVDLGQLLDQGDTILVMLRGYPGYQCPLCSRQAGEYSQLAEKIKAAGLRVVLVYPGGVGNLDQRAKEFLGQRTLPEPVTLLLDEDYALTNALGLRWDAPQETAYPSTLIVRKGGEIAWAKVSKTHGGRVAAKQALAEATK